MSYDTSVGYDSFGAVLYGHQVSPEYRCADCSSPFPSPAAAAACCDLRYEKGYD